MLGFFEHKEIKHLHDSIKQGNTGLIKRAMCMVRLRSSETGSNWITCINGASFTKELYQRDTPTLDEMAPIIKHYSAHLMPCAVVHEDGLVKFEDL